MEGDWIVVGAWDVLIVTADVRDNLDELGVFVSLILVGAVERWPSLGDEHAFGPAEGLPDGFGDKRCKWVKHGENLLESVLEKVGILPKFLGFDEPVSVFVPDEIIDEVAGFSEAVIFHELLELFVGLIDLFANPIFAKVLKLDFVVVYWIVVDDILD
jgi:hypothetical protein